MSLNVAALEILVAKGLSADDILEVARALEVRKDPTAAERMRRHRAKKSGNDGERVTRNVTANPPYDIYSNPQNSLSAKADCPSLADRVVEAWNAGPGKNGARKATSLDASRRKWLSQRVKDHGEESVFTAIANLGASPFHCGVNDRDWKANIGWLLKSPEKFLNALEMEEARAPPNGLVAQAAQYAKPPPDRIAA